ncbi:unnamed protein product, partial [Phaeothamnion confervicola]
TTETPPIVATAADGSGAPLRVHLRQWGCAFTEGLWAAVLAAFAAAPAELLAGPAGAAAGVDRLWDEYARLLVVQREYGNAGAEPVAALAVDLAALLARIDDCGNGSGGGASGENGGGGEGSLKGGTLKGDANIHGGESREDRGDAAGAQEGDGSRRKKRKTPIWQGRLDRRVPGLWERWSIRRVLETFLSVSDGSGDEKAASAVDAPAADEADGGEAAAGAEQALSVGSPFDW